MVDIDGTFFKVDMDALMKWVVETPASEKNITTTTTITYPAIDDEEITEKEISENKSTLNDIMNNIRYDFVRNLLNVVFAPNTTEISQMPVMSLQNMSVGQKIAFNGLLSKNIITEIKK